MSDDLSIVPYTPHHALELVMMWRASFERGVGVIDPHPIEEQVRYLEERVVRENDVMVVEGKGGAIVAFIAFTPERIVQLYVHVDHQGKGIGTRLLDLAKRRSHGRLRLFTFQRNEKAQCFYERHGFTVVARGFEPEWGLEDIEYEWRAG